jgi:hypothetical protein
MIAGGLALGFAASRFLKASSSGRYESSTRLPARRADVAPPPLPAGSPRGDVGAGNLGGAPLDR